MAESRHCLECGGVIEELNEWLDYCKECWHKAIDPVDEPENFPEVE